MINPKINALLLCVVCVPAAGTPNEQLIDLLTCSPKSNSSTLQAQVKSGAIRSAGEAMVLAKPASTDKACVKNATIHGSFGTLSVLGESCGSLTGAVSSQSVTEEFEGTLGTVGHRANSAMA